MIRDELCMAAELRPVFKIFLKTQSVKSLSTLLPMSSKEGEGQVTALVAICKDCKSIISSG